MAKDHVKEGGSKVDYVGLVDDEHKVLSEANLPSIMKMVGNLLPARGSSNAEFFSEGKYASSQL